MLKGIKIKNSNEIPKPQKKWKKQTEKSEETLLPENEVTENQQLRDESYLQQQVDELWNTFCQGNQVNSVETCQNLFVKTNQYFTKIFRGQKNFQCQTIGEKDDIFDNEEFDYLNQNTEHFKNSEIRKQIKQEKVKNLCKYNYDEVATNFFKKYTSLKNNEDLIEQEYNDAMEEITGNQNDKQSQDKKKSKKTEKIEQKQIQHNKQQESRILNKADKVFTQCNYCLANGKIKDNQLISAGNYVMLIIPEQNRYQQKIFHLQIVPNNHYQSLVDLEEEVYDEVRNFMKCLVQSQDKIDFDVIFMETAIKFSHLPHALLDCICLDRKDSVQLNVYFKKEMEELGSEWATHKKVIEIRKEKGGLRRQIPKNFPYFYVDFSLGLGYVNIIEDEKTFNKNFGHEIIASILKMDKNKVLYPEKFTKQQVLEQKNKFAVLWKDYDWTSMLKN